MSEANRRRGKDEGGNLPPEAQREIIEGLETVDEEAPDVSTDDVSFDESVDLSQELPVVSPEVISSNNKFERKTGNGTLKGIFDED